MALPQPLSWLDGLVFGIRRIYYDVAGQPTAAPDRPSVYFQGDVTVTDDVANKTTVVTFSANAGQVTSISADAPLDVNATDPAHPIITFAEPISDAQHGARAGGELHAEATADEAGFMSSADKVLLDALPLAADIATITYVDDAIAAIPAGTYVAGAGLTESPAGTFNVGANGDGSIVANANDLQVGVINDAQHGTRGGGTTHANCIAGGAAGFMTGTDKTKLDGITAGAAVASVGVTAPIVNTGSSTAPVLAFTPSANVAMGGWGFTGCASLDHNGSPVAVGATASAVAIGNGAIVISLTGVSDSVYAGLTTTKTAGRRLRNTTPSDAVNTVRYSPSDEYEGHARVTGADKTFRTRWTLIPRTNGAVDLVLEYSTDAGATWSEAHRFTTATSGQFATAFQAYAFASGFGGFFYDASGSGLFFDGSGAVNLKSYSSTPLLLQSDSDLTVALPATGIEKRQHGTAGVNYVNKTAKVLTPSPSSTTNVWTFAMADNSAIKVEIEGYAYLISDPGLRVYFGKRGGFNRNGGAPSADFTENIHADHVIGVWGAPPTLAFAVGTPGTNDVSIQAVVGAGSIKFILTEIRVFACTTSA